jgi:hypothetical protein
MKLPVYSAKLNDDDLGIVAIALVDEPAMEATFSLYNKKHLYSVDEDRKMITYPLIVKDKLIYRNDPYPHYIKYEGETIMDIAKKYHTSKNITFNEQHTTEEVDKLKMVEMWIKGEEDKANKLGFSEIPEGSLMVTLYCEDEKYWKKIKKGEEFNGLSMEIFNSHYSDNNISGVDDFIKLIDSLDDKQIEELLRSI